MPQSEKVMEGRMAASFFYVWQVLEFQESSLEAYFLAQVSLASVNAIPPSFQQHDVECIGANLAHFNEPKDNDGALAI